MKYPQLVSTRAVNAISDWLVSRLEQLGVEAPQIYTRLLLSLLQSSVHINDPIEFSSLETFIVNRKGGGSIRRYLQFDANTLKKLNAIQCLSEIVSPEQELTSIESLVDELWEKLKDIEKQTERNDGIDDTVLIDEALIHNNKSKADPSVEEATIYSLKRANTIFCKTLNNEKVTTATKTDLAEKNNVIAKKIETETDPKKRYFNAFPALSKEMEDSFRIWRQNAKSLTWPPPINRCNSTATANQSTDSIMSTAFGAVCANERKTLVAAEEMLKNDDELLLDAKNLTASQLNNFQQNHAIVTSSNSGLKRKTKRRKSQSMSKGRTMVNTRKNEGYNMANSNQAVRKQNRHLSPTQWDTDFDGYWEMGRDLIKEFFAKQGDRNRNRCNSEGSSVHPQQEQHYQPEIQKKLQTFEFSELAMNCNKTAAVAIAANAADGVQSPQLMPQVDISFCYDENADDDDTYKSISELTADSSLNTSRSSPRRLYQRLVMSENVDDAGEIETNNNIKEDQIDFMQFKAKFDNNIAALWQDVSNDNEQHENYDKTSATNAATALWSAPSNIPWPTVEPIKENLKNFWSIFNNHPLDFAKILQRQQQQKQHQNDTSNSQKLNNNNKNITDTNAANTFYASLPFETLTKTSVQDDNANFISMPPNLDGDRVDNMANSSINNNKRRHEGRNTTPVGVFLKDSIWSENLNGDKNTDTDESFYLKVWNSNKKLYNLDAVYEAKLTEASDDSKMNSSSSSASFQYYGNSKWSEGINAGPIILQQQFQQQQLQQLQQQQPQQKQHEQNKILNKEKKINNPISFTEQNINSIDCVDASMPTTASSSSCSYMLSSSGVFSGQTPSLQSSQQSWHATDKKITSGQKSLTEMYGISSPGLHTSSNGNNNNEYLPKEDEEINQLPRITLPNHSNESSGFSDYARMKTIAKSMGQLDNIKQQQLNYQSQLPLIKEQPHYADDENLLTSERTHFQPIKAYADGYTFDVCSALDVINYRRSESGYLYYESHKYLEYTRNDSYMAEDEGNGNGGGISTAPLYAGSNCEAAVARKQQKEPKNDELVLKFRIMNREMACQTDDEETVMLRNSNNMHAMPQMHPLYLIFSGASTDGLKIQTSGQACSEAIEALNRAVAAAAKAAAERDRLQLEQQQPWLGLHEIVGSNSRNIGLWTTVQAPPSLLHDEYGGDEIDFCNESTCAFGVDNASLMEQQQWPPMQRCQLNVGSSGGETFLTADGCRVHAAASANAATTDNSSGSGLVHNVGELHALWGVCAACNGEYKEAPPANHLLRDELNLEADQIMSDLKNMQDLYIGTAGDDSGEDLVNEQDWQSIANGGIRHPMAIIANKANMANINDEGNENDTLATTTWNTANDLEQRQKETQQKVLQQVNKLIANLMRPERANDTNILADTAASAQRELGESLWPDDGEHSIWKNRNELQNEGVSGGCSGVGSGSDVDRKLTQSAVDARNSVLRTEEKQFLAQLTWEHNNLAELWSKQTPPPIATSSEQQKQHNQQLPNSNCSSTFAATAKRNETIANKDVVQETDVDNQAKENSKKYTTDINSPTNIKYKRIQQFLNSTINGNNITNAKLKLGNRKRRHSASQNYAILHSGGGGVGVASAFYTATSKTNTLNAANTKNNNNNNNNNNFKITDLNNVNMKASNGSGIAGCVDIATDTSFELFNTSNTSASVFSDDVDMEQGNSSGVSSFYNPSALLIINNNHDVGVGVAGGAADGINVILPPKQTIITCKYWTTIDPMIDSTEDTIDCNEDGGGDDDITTATFSCLVDKNDSLLKHVTMLARPLTR